MIRRFVFICTAPLAGPARAEVCDKVVGEWWQPGHGSVDVAVPEMPGAWMSAEGWKLAIAALMVLLVWIARVRMARWIAGPVLAIAALHSLLAWGLSRSGDGGIVAAAIREGCLFSPLSGLVSDPPAWVPLAWGLAAIGLLLLLRPRERAAGRPGLHRKVEA